MVSATGNIRARPLSRPLWSRGQVWAWKRRLTSLSVSATGNIHARPLSRPFWSRRQVWAWKRRLTSPSVSATGNVCARTLTPLGQNFQPFSFSKFSCFSKIFIPFQNFHRPCNLFQYVIKIFPSLGGSVFHLISFQAQLSQPCLAHRIYHIQQGLSYPLYSIPLPQAQPSPDHPPL